MRFFTLLSALAAAGFAAAQEAARFGSVEAEPCVFTGGQDVRIVYNATTAIAAGHAPESVSVWIQGTFDDTGNQTPFFRLAETEFHAELGETFFAFNNTIPEQINNLGASNWVVTAFIIYEQDGLTQFGGISNSCPQ
ncbi:hypothetical protein D9758_011370 [Tetrapyrgos nigripes]|uniref:Uncharacterized protein n=1 Tax=Tetrapyrgos nigripes TaxID=182062 RepID=A0A8H5LK16_9AGAR|nr:hypothetical protein D9758_011370 [Tetrapyrgos nigripes]